MQPRSSAPSDRARTGDAEGPPEYVFDVAHDALSYARERDYTGWDYADGMSSRLLRALPLDNRWLNLAVQETIKRAPRNLRPLLFVQQRRNFMGAGLFAVVHRDLDAVSPGDSDHATEACRLADWLLENRCPGYDGFCGGHRHENQHMDHKTLPTEPDVVTTSYAVRGLLAAAEYDPSYADAARTAEAFMIENMNYRAVDGGAKIDYYPKDTADHYTLNAGAIAARTLLDIYEWFGGESRIDRARALLDYVAARQTDVGGWYYRDPPAASHLSMDSHHNGFVLECLQRYHGVTGDDRYAEALDAGLEFYRGALFEDDGAPNWDETSAYPRDVHAAAQGVLVFSDAGNLQFARRIIDWTLEHLYDGNGRFFFRQQRYYTKTITLMRWCQAWMTYAITTHLRVSSGVGEPVGT